MTSETPTVIPMLAYENPAAALDWLAQAFGFVERTRITMPDGSIGHAEMAVGDNGLIMLATPSPHYRSPATHRRECELAAKWLEVPYVVDGVLVNVDDVEAHRRRAEEAGAAMLSGIEDAPHGRLYRAEDLEGHRWMFMERKPTGGQTDWVPPGQPYPKLDR